MRTSLQVRRHFADRLFRILCTGSTVLCVLILFLIVGKLFLDGVGNLSWRFITSPPVTRAAKAGILTPLIGSLYVMAITAAIALPVGIGSALWLEEFNTRKTRLTQVIQVNISNLAGVPSIVYGILGLAVFVRFFAFGKSILAGGLTMSLLILPTVIIVTQEALRAVPKSYREGSLALGATRWQTIAGQVLPSAMPGILTGIILSISRAIGETAPLIVVGAAGYVTFVPKSVHDAYSVLPIQIFSWARSSDPQVHANAGSAILFLIILLLSFNSIAIILRARGAKSAS